MGETPTIIERDNYLIGAKITDLKYGPECFTNRPISAIVIKTKDGQFFEIAAEELRNDVPDLEITEIIP